MRLKINNIDIYMCVRGDVNYLKVISEGLNFYFVAVNEDEQGKNKEQKAKHEGKGETIDIAVEGGNEEQLQQQQQRKHSEFSCYLVLAISPLLLSRF